MFLFNHDGHGSGLFQKSMLLVSAQAELMEIKTPNKETVAFLNELIFEFEGITINERGKIDTDLMLKKV